MSEAKDTRVKPIPEGYHSVTPYLCVKGGADAIEFYKKAFGAKEVMRMGGPEGKIGHAELQLGDSRVMLADEFPEMGFLSPQSVGGVPVMMHLYVEDVDSTVSRATNAGAKVTRPIEDQFYGDRAGQIEDPFGHKWYVSTHKEDLTMDQIKERQAKAFAPSS
jgi:PhnB protein